MYADKQVKGLILGLLAVILFSLTLPVTRYVIQTLDPWFVAFSRTVIAATFALVILLVKRVAFPKPQQVKKLLAAAVGITVGFPVFLSLAMQITESARGAIVIGLLPLGVAVLAAIIAKEKLSKKFWGAVLFGAVVVFAFTLSQQTQGGAWGDVLLLLAVVFASFGYVVSGHLSKSMPGWQVIAWVNVLVAPLLIIPVFYLAPSELFQISWKVWLGLFYLGLISQLFGFFLWNTGLALGGIALVGQTQLLQVFFTLAIAALVFNEAVHWTMWLVASAVVVIIFLGKKYASDTQHVKQGDSAETPESEIQPIKLATSSLKS